MKIRLTEQELINIVATLSECDMVLYSSGRFAKWKGQKNYSDSGDEFYDFESKYDEKGNLKNLAEKK